MTPLFRLSTITQKKPTKCFKGGVSLPFIGSLLFKPMKTLELHYPIIQFLTVFNNYEMKNFFEL